mmetsp:Transcript_19639/g.59509  ORF Transcript_19639/g.59509 Transcript_19639/m.59509 type:complete len:242 (-) Transcript_19639:364-1089(-)
MCAACPCRRALAMRVPPRCTRQCSRRCSSRAPIRTRRSAGTRLCSPTSSRQLRRRRRVRSASLSPPLRVPMSATCARAAAAGAVAGAGEAGGRPASRAPRPSSRPKLRFPFPQQLPHPCTLVHLKSFEGSPALPGLPLSLLPFQSVPIISPNSLPARRRRPRKLLSGRANFSFSYPLHRDSHPSPFRAHAIRVHTLGYFPSAAAACAAAAVAVHICLPRARPHRAARESVQRSSRRRRAVR